jgi:hypothetical protein
MQISTNFIFCFDWIRFWSFGLGYGLYSIIFLFYLTVLGNLVVYDHKNGYLSMVENTLGTCALINTINFKIKFNDHSFCM